MSVVRGVKDFFLWNIFRIIPTLGWLLVICVAWYTGSLFVSWLSYGFVFSYTLITFVLIVIIQRQIKILIRPEPAFIQPMVRYGFPLMISLIPTSSGSSWSP